VIVKDSNQINILYIIGGETVEYDGQTSADIWTFNTSTNEWLKPALTYQSECFTGIIKH
jgi:hypothetical protein